MITSLVNLGVQATKSNEGQCAQKEYRPREGQAVFNGICGVGDILRTRIRVHYGSLFVAMKRYWEKHEVWLGRDERVTGHFMETREKGEEKGEE